MKTYFPFTYLIIIKSKHKETGSAIIFKAFAIHKLSFRIPDLRLKIQNSFTDVKSSLTLNRPFSLTLDTMQILVCLFCDFLVLNYWLVLELKVSILEYIKLIVRF